MNFAMGSGAGASVLRALGLFVAAAVAVGCGQARAADITPYQPASSSYDPLSTAVFFGGSLKEESYFAHLGLVHAFSGNLAQDGFLGRFSLGYGGYDYDTGRVAGGEVDADLATLDLMAGYQWYMPTFRYSLYGGANLVDNDLSPNDPGNSTGGQKWGFKVQGEAETSPDSIFYTSAAASYSTANNDYWARGRLGVKGGTITVGPELSLMGSDAYDELRYGVFVSGPQIGGFTTEASVGYADTSGATGDSSVYGTIGFSTAF